jgi:hypothetical protein
VSPTHLVPAVCFLLSGCLTSVHVIKPDLEDYGSAPRDHESTIKSYYKDILTAPASVEYVEISKPKKAYVGARFDGASYGYLVCVTYKVKNQDGGNSQMQDGLLIRKDSVDLRIPESIWFGRKLC